MQSSAFRLLSAIVPLSLLAVLALLVGLTLRSQPTVTIQPTPTLPPTLTPTHTATPFQTLGADLLVPEGGYRFQPLLGYEVTIQGAAVALTQPFSPTNPADANPAGANPAGANTVTIGLDARTREVIGAGAGQPLADIVLQVAQPFIERTQAQAGAVETLTVAGAEAAAVTLRGDLDGAPVAGRIVVAQPDDDRLFIAAATAPSAQWEAETAAALAHVLQGVAFFEPVAAAIAPTATPTEPPRPTSTATQAATATLATATPATGTPATATLITATLITATPAVPPVTIVRPGALSGTLTATPVVTITLLLAPTPTPSATPRSTAQPWTAVTDGNWMNELVVTGNTIWIATDGGALAWTRGSATPVKFTSLNGLTANRLTAVANCALPELGVIFGSDAGLQIVDPAAGGWRQLNSSNSELSYDDVVDLACDPDAGYLVVGYAQHGIDLFEERSGEWRHLDRSSGLASNRVQAVAVVGALDEIWVAGADGVTVSAGADSTFYNAQNSPLESNRLGAIAVDADDVVWLGGDGALYRVAGESWTVYNAESVADAAFPVRLITGVAPTNDGALWLGDIDGALCRFDPATERCTAAFRAEPGMATAPLTSLALDADAQLYFTTAGDGFSVYDGAAWQQFARPNEGLRGNAVQAATVDPDGALWVVTEAGVQQVVAPNRPPLRILEAPIAPATIQTIYAADNGDLWIGGAGAGVWDGTAWRVYTTTDGLAGASVRAISEDSRGRIWLGADAGISIWNGQSFFNLTSETGLPSADIRALLADGDAMWIGSAGGGLYRFVGNQLEVRNTDNTNLPSDVITALALTDAGTLFVGSDAGLAELRDGVIAAVPTLGARAVTQLLAYAGSVWVGVAEDGLFYDAGAGWQQETTAGALPANQVTALAAAANTVWVGGATGGLVRYELPPKE